MLDFLAGMLSSAYSFLGRKITFLHKGVQDNLALDVPGVTGEPGRVVWLLVGDIDDGGLLATPLAPY